MFIPFCYYEAAVNMLTNPALDPFGKIPEFKYCAVRVRAGGDAAAAGQLRRRPDPGRPLSYAARRTSSTPLPVTSA